MQIRTEYAEIKTKIAVAKQQIKKQSVDFEREIEEEIITHANGEVQSETTTPISVTEPEVSSESKKSTRRHKKSSSSSTRKKSFEA